MLMIQFYYVYLRHFIIAHLNLLCVRIQNIYYACSLKADGCIKNVD